MNYIKIVNWFWEEVPFMEGCKAAHISLFFALLDSINRNKWQPTRIPYEYLVTKCKLAKRSYIDSREWLIKNNIIEMRPGQNAYYMASFSLGIAVQKCTTNDTDIAGIAVQKCTTNDTKNAPLTAPINKPKTSKPKTKKNIPASPEINFSFEKFWKLYDKKVGNKIKLEKKWNALTDEERQKAISHIPLYKTQTLNRQYRKNPDTYLNNKSFNDEIIETNHKPHYNDNKKFKQANYEVPL